MYKKITVITTIILASLFLVSCKDDTKLNNAYEELTYDLLLNDNDSKQSITTNLKLIDELNDVLIEWDSSNSNVITNLGVVTRTNLEVVVKLEARLTYNNTFKVKTFEFKVLKIAEESSFIVKFISDDKIFNETEVIEGNKVNKPNDPNKDGYTFVEWQLDGKAFDFNTSINEDLILIAFYEKIETIYTITFDSKGGSNINLEEVIEGNKVNKPNDPNKDGYTFVEWQLDGKAFDFNTSINEDITLVAIWKVINSYTVTFNTKGGNNISSQNVREDELFKKPNDPVKLGYSFINWTLNGEIFAFNNYLTSDITLEANYEVITYEITYILSVGNNNANNPKYYTIEESFTLNDPVNHNDEFLGWFTKDGTEVSSITNKTGDLVLYAKFLQADTFINVITINGNTYIVDEIINRNITSRNNDGSQILFDSFDPVQIYDKKGYQDIVKTWNDVFFNDTVFIVVENNRVVEGFKRNGNVILNSNNTLALKDGTNDSNNLGKWKEFNLSENSLVIIAQNQSDFETGLPIHNDDYFNELISYSYMDEFLLIESISKDDLLTYVMRDGKYLLDHNNKKIPLPVYEEKDEVRAIWMATVANIDLPKMVNGNINAYKNAITSRLDQIAALNFNTVFFQIRPMNDALYESELAPWSRYITGTEGVNPGFDVLEFVINEAHQRNLELHGWLNPYRVANSNTILNTMHEDNFAKKNPHLLLTSGVQTILNPGLTEVQDYIVDVIDEIITKYPSINGIHFDDYFYLSSLSEDSSSPDYQTYLDNRENSNQSIATFRRESVTTVIRNIFNLVENYNNQNNLSIKFGIAPTGIWDNIGSNSQGSHTAGQAHYTDLYADTKGWIEEEIIHYILPQLYWPFDKFNASGRPVAPFANLVQWWNEQVEGKNVDLLIGIGFYRQDGSDWLYYNELSEQIRYLELFENVNGLSIYTYHTLNSSNGDIKRSINLLNQHFWKNYVNTKWLDN